MGKSTLKKALARIGSDPKARARLLQALKDWESRNIVDGEALRETTSGHIVDALYADVETVTRTIRLDGFGSPGSARELTFTILYRSKIAREFAMAHEPLDHVWEPQTTKLLCYIAKNADTALIGGAYSGDHAVPMMVTMREHGGTCICFEPNLEQSAFLISNAQTNGLTNYTLTNEGLWSETAELVMVGHDSHAHPEVYHGQAGKMFQAVSIDDYCRAHFVEKVDIIMLDIEGGEFEALKGAQRFLSEPAETAPEIIFEIHRSYVDWSEGLAQTPICDHLLELGYELYAIRDYQGNETMTDQPIEVVPLATCYLEGPPHGFNIFASKHPACIERYGLQVRDHVSPKLLKHRDPALHQPLT